jgi:ubiquinone/menaquinone biosynthesis C-methylase UbiE
MREYGPLYDLVYAAKDYGAEARAVEALVDELAPHARSLLDVACGTGRHLEHLAGRFAVEGADASRA